MEKIDGHVLSRTDLLYRQEMGNEAFERQRQIGARVCNCGVGAPIGKKWAHKPGCRAKKNSRLQV